MTDAEHGPFDVATIENETLRVSVVPGYGAKVIDLTDKRTGRNWLVTGSPTEVSAEDAVFGGAQAYGWDECFPTVAPCADPASDDGHMLRDHGALWGRLWRTAPDSGSIATTFEHEEFAFSRRLSLDDNRLTADYTLVSRAGRDLPYLWSAHPLFDLDAGETVALADTSSVSATYIKACGRVIAPTTLGWPQATLADQSIDLSQVKPIDEDFAAKLYCDSAHQVVIAGERGRLIVSWRRVGSLGIWLDYGGWPDIAPVHQVAIEPTTAPVDDLQSAIDIDRQQILQPRQTHRWSMDLTLETGSADAAITMEPRQ